MVILAALLSLSALGNGDATETDEETCKRPFWRRWFGFGLGNAETAEEAIANMAEKLGLDEAEVEQITPIVEAIADLQERSLAQREALVEIIGPKVEAYKESVMENGSEAASECAECGATGPECKGLAGAGAHARYLPLRNQPSDAEGRLDENHWLMGPVPYESGSW